MVGARSFPGNPFDGHTLAAQLEQTTNLLQDLNRAPKQVVVDLGYRGVDADNPGVEIIHRGRYKTMTDQQKRWLKRRQAIEPMIGHAKSDNRMDRCWLQGALGDALHALSCAAGYNIRWLLRAIVRLGLKVAFLRLFLTAMTGLEKVKSTMLIRLSHPLTRCSGARFFGIKLGIGGRGNSACNAEQRTERIERVETAVEPKRELVEVRLQVLRADAMMDGVQPSLEVRKYEMNDGHVLFGDLRIAPFRDGHVVIAVFGKPGVAAPIICDDSGTWYHDVFDEAAERISAPVKHDRKPNTSGIATVPAVIVRAGAFAVSYFNGSGHNSLVVCASPFSACPSAHIGFIDLNVFSGCTPDPILIGPHHGDTQLVENLKGCFVARQPELALELNCRDVRCLTGDEIGRPKPYRERRVRALHDGAGRETCIVAAMTAAKHPRPRGNVPWRIRRPTVRTDKSITPSGALKICSARCLIREDLLKFRQRTRKRQVAPLKYIDSHDRLTFKQKLNIPPVVTGCDNRISMKSTMPIRLAQVDTELTSLTAVIF